ncbi:three-Cys-motif partner protein TcmP [Streptomyces sp. NPDC051105]|uniref:three-Cys-motif partner protein TcmP n=1 Tax=Streptomyces sp. NPDC051105 TaxID=3154843 RepID=UPI0034217E47
MRRAEELKERTVWKSDPHTQVKHLVYRHYLQCWMGKSCQTFPEATIVDAFAGPGVYTDSPPGSPVVIARTFLEHTAYQRFNRLNLICLEERPDRVEELHRQFAKLPKAPKLHISIQPPGKFAEQQPRLSALARRPRGDPRPVGGRSVRPEERAVLADPAVPCRTTRRGAVHPLHERTAPLLPA